MTPLKEQDDSKMHPGEILRRELIEPRMLTITQVAKHLAVSYVTISKIVNGRSNITPNMAIRIAYVFGSNPEYWLSLQQEYDLKNAQNEFKDYNKLTKI